MLQYFLQPRSSGDIIPTILKRDSRNWLETRYLAIVRTLTGVQIDRSFFTSVNGPMNDGDLNVDFSDIKNLQILTDKLHQISHLLMLNMNVGTQVQSFVKRVKSAWLPLDFSVIWLFDECDAKIEEFLFSHRNHKGRIDSMIARSKGIFALV